VNDNPTATLRPIQGFLGYFIGTDGSVWSRRIKGHKAGLGPWKRVSVYRRPYGGRYCVVCLRHPTTGKVHCLYIHVLVLSAFGGPCPPGYHALHGDNNTANNRLDNLRWGTPLENAADKTRHGTQTRGEQHSTAKLSNADVDRVFDLRAQGWKQREIGTALGITQSTISDILRGKSWAHRATEPRTGPAAGPEGTR
jgi:hypothetical protein